MSKGKIKDNDGRLKHRLAEIITKSGYTQSELARAMNIDRWVVNRWVNGERKINMEWLIKLAATLGVAVDDILSPDEPIKMIGEVEMSVFRADKKPYYRAIAGNAEVTKLITKDTEKMIRELLCQ